MGGSADEIAFFGGSFTGISEKKQNEYLSIAKKYIESKNVKSIRLSTRPDYISKDTVKRLFEYGVRNIELGAQSMDEEVLILAKRGHTKEDVEKACKLINEFGFELGVQMMVGFLAVRGCQLMEKYMNAQHNSVLVCCILSILTTI